MKKPSFKIFTLLLLFLLPVFLFAWDQKLISLAERFAKVPPDSSLTEADRAYLYRNNPEINYLAREGVINNNTFQANQKFFETRTSEFMQNAADKSGLTVSKQHSTGPAKPGADYDGHIGKADRNVTLQDAQKMRNNVNSEINKWLKDNGQASGRRVDWSKKLNIDAMPLMNQTTQFEVINEWINKQGGRAYTSREAGLVEQFMRNGKNDHISLSDAKIYNEHMNTQIKHALELIEKNNQSIAKLQARAAKGPLPPAAADALKNLQTKGDILNSQVAKYLTRKDAVNNMMADRFGTKTNTTSTPDVAKANARTPDSATAGRNVVKNAQNLMNQADDAFNNTAKNVSNAAERLDNIKVGLARAESQIRTTLWNKAASYAGGNQQLTRLIKTPDRTLMKLGYRERGAPGSLQRNMKGYAPKALQTGGLILLAFQFYDVGMEAYRTGNYKQGAVNLAITYAFAKGMEFAITKVFGSFLAANPVTATAIGTLAISYGLTREIMSRVEINGKSLDVHTQEFIDSQIFLSDQYDVDAKAQIGKMYIEAIKKGYKLPPGMTIADGWKKILENYDKGGKVFDGVFAPPTGSVFTVVENSTIINTVEGSSEASGKSKINTGISAVNAKIEDSYIENQGDVEAVAKENSRINTGVNLNQSTVQRSFISTRTEGKVEAVNKSTINTGLSANNSEIKDSHLTSDVEGTFKAQDNSTINAGIQANNARISNANLSNTVQGANVTAKNRSTVNQGTKFDKEANEQETPDLQFNFGK